MDIQHANTFPCRTSMTMCQTGEKTYIWDKIHIPDCALFSTKITEGSLVTATNEQDEKQTHFIGKDSLVHLKMFSKVSMCDKAVYTTDFNCIFVINLAEEEPINQEIQNVQIDAFKEMAIRDAFVFRSLKSFIKEKIRGLAVQHCKVQAKHAYQLTKVAIHSNPAPFHLKHG